MKVLFAHLLNNYTGAPKVLSLELDYLAKNSLHKIFLLTSKNDGLLNNIQNVTYYDNWYRWRNNKFARAFQFALSQIRIFFFTMFFDFDILYMNTVVPFGAALAAQLRKKKTVYHVHEIYINPGFVKKLYYKIMKASASRIICVSKYVQKNISCFSEKTITAVIHNPVASHKTPENIDSYLREKLANRIIFMPTSLKEYKGVFQFAELAKSNPDFNFILLCSASLEEIQDFFKQSSLPANLTLAEKQKDLERFYHKAMITINLSLQDKCIETFGLTLIESFNTLTPAIAPDFGGPKEIITDGKNGFLVNPYDLSRISSSVRKITQDFETYKSFAFSAKKRADDFSIEKFIKQVSEVLDNEQ